nr:hypothetical protein [Candidatus Levybacteria bacterium]
MDANEKIQETQTQPVEQPQKKGGFPIKTLLLIITLALITVGLVILAVMPKQPKSEPTPQVQITPNPIQTVLTISSVPVPQATPSSYTTDVVINTGQSNVTSVQLELSYDPDILTKVDITPGSFFINPRVELKNIDETNGRITFALSSSDNQGALGQGLLARISFKTLKKNVSTTIDFLPKTKVSAKDTAESVLKSTVKATFNLSPTPTIIASPTAT